MQDLCEKEQTYEGEKLLNYRIFTIRKQSQLFCSVQLPFNFEWMYSGKPCDTQKSKTCKKWKGVWKCYRQFWTEHQCTEILNFL